MNDNAPMMIVLSFTSSCVVSMEGIVPDMERCLLVIVFFGERNVVVKR